MYGGSEFENMLEKVVATLKKYHLVSPGDKVLLAVSGGADSVAMLICFTELQKKFKLKLHVAHLNHGFRGEESRGDAVFVNNLCEKLGVAATIENANLPEILSKTGESLQAGARRVRYQFLEKVAEQEQANKIAVAQNADDQAETVLINLLRGGGTSGLKGIPIKRDRIIRPLIEVTRNEIESFCKQHAIEFRTDSSNLKTVYLRNSIRLKLIPHLQEEYNPNLIENLNHVAKIMAEEDKHLTAETNAALEKMAVMAKHGIKVKLGPFLKLPLALQRRVVRMAWQKSVSISGGESEGLQYTHVDLAIDLITKGQVGKKIDLPKRVNLNKGYDDVYFQVATGEKEEKNCDNSQLEPVSVPGNTYVESMNINIIAKIESKSILCNENVKSNKREQVSLCYNMLANKSLYIRTRKPGDKFYPLGMKGSKKLKDFFIDNKVEQSKRDDIPLLVTASDEIVWVIGYRLDERFRVTTKSDKVLIIEIEKLCN